MAVISKCLNAQNVTKSKLSLFGCITINLVVKLDFRDVIKYFAGSKFKSGKSSFLKLNVIKFKLRLSSWCLFNDSKEHIKIKHNRLKILFYKSNMSSSDSCHLNKNSSQDQCHNFSSNSKTFQINCIVSTWECLLKSMFIFMSTWQIKTKAYK